MTTSTYREQIRLQGPNDDRFGLRFHDMSEAYSKRYRAIAHEEKEKRLGITLHEGVYAALAGAELRDSCGDPLSAGVIGADLVGMSTVPEAIIARHMGIKVLAISCVTNMAAGILDQPINHLEVLETGERVKADFVALLRAVLPEMAKDVEGSPIRRQVGRTHSATFMLGRPEKPLHSERLVGRKASGLSAPTP